MDWWIDETKPIPGDIEVALLVIVNDQFAQAVRAGTKIRIEVPQFDWDNTNLGEKYKDLGIVVEKESEMHIYRVEKKYYLYVITSTDVVDSGSSGMITAHAVPFGVAPSYLMNPDGTVTEYHYSARATPNISYYGIEF